MALSAPAVEGTEAEQSVVLEDMPAEPLAAEEAEPADAVVLGACVAVFEPSPGNCTAVCGLAVCGPIDGAALTPPDDPASDPANDPVSDPIAVADPPGSAIDELVALLKEPETTVPLEPAGAVPVVAEADGNAGLT